MLKTLFKWNTQYWRIQRHEQIETKTDVVLMEEICDSYENLKILHFI